MYRPLYVHTYSDAEVEIPGYRYDPAPTHDADYQHQPWHQMAHTYAWVDDHHHSRRANHSRKTEQWVLEQRVYSDHFRSSVGMKDPRKTWEGVAYAHELEGEEWKRREAEIRRKVMQREADRTRIVQEQLRRAEERIRQRREAERQRSLEERTRACLERREHEKRKEKAILDAWTGYETRWAAMQGSRDPLTFLSIPWPVLSAPDQPESMELADIASFLLSPAHSQAQTRRERIRAAQLRWHPDRFRRYMGRVAETDKAAVEEGVGIVARCLNDLVVLSRLS
ncbi:hypothetical protein APHAL10511_004870 [Amanita phalloides]|nr:hypothetical protein APHAL10511_004870 [Amanita phalloides]